MNLEHMVKHKYNNQVHILIRQMINKILGRKDKGGQVFHVPEKKYCHEAKKLSKMDKKDLLDEIEHMEKYIGVVCSKLEEGKKQYEKAMDKLDETGEKLNVVNSKMAMISNEHEELQVKFTNLSNSLEILSREKQSIYKNQIKFLETRDLVKSKLYDLPAILSVYHDQVLLVDKIVHQNKQLKQKYTQLQTDFFALSEKIGDKNKINDEVQVQQKSKQIEETQPDDDRNNQYKLLAETKEQMIGLLNRKITEHQDKINEMQEKLSDLTHQIESKNTSLRQKEEEITHFHDEVNEYKKKISQLKDFQQEMLQAQQLLQSTMKKQELDLEKQNYEMKELVNKLKFSEQKNILISNYQSEANSSSSNQFQLQKASLSHELKTKDLQIQNLKQKNSELNKTIEQMDQNLRDLRTKLKDMQELQYKLNQEIQQKGKLSKKLEDQEESYQIKFKKFEFNLNQQRIKTDALKRSLSNLELKEQQNQKILNQMYEQKVVNDNKVAKMEAKLKNYKQMIQYLQKEKVEMEKTFESKIKNMEEIVVNDSDGEQELPQSDHSDKQTLEQEQVIISKLNRKIVDLEQEIEFLKEENRALASQKGQLEVSNLELQKNVRVINDKRHEMLKQLSRMSSVSASDSNCLNSKPNNLIAQGRQKKVAEKALRGFDIMSKNLSSLYKQFLNVHLADIQKKAVKDMEGSINLLIGKCQDMKDIFQGYL